MYEKMTMREWSTSSTPTSTQAPGLLSLAEPNNNDTIVIILWFNILCYLRILLKDVYQNICLTRLLL